MLNKSIKITTVFLSLLLLFNIFSTSHIQAESDKLAVGFKDNFIKNLTGAGIRSTYIDDANSGQASASYGDTLIANIILYILSFVGIMFLALVLFSGFQWMTSNGSEDKISKAKKRIINGVIGLGLALLAFIVTTTIYSYLDKKFLTSDNVNTNAPAYQKPCNNFQTEGECPTDHCVWVVGLGNAPIVGGYCSEP